MKCDLCNKEIEKNHAAYILSRVVVGNDDDYERLEDVETMCVICDRKREWRQYERAKGKLENPAHGAV